MPSKQLPLERFVEAHRDYRLSRQGLVRAAHGFIESMVMQPCRVLQRLEGFSTTFPFDDECDAWLYLHQSDGELIRVDNLIRPGYDDEWAKALLLMPELTRDMVPQIIDALRICYLSNLPAMRKFGSDSLGHPANQP